MIETKLTTTADQQHLSATPRTGTTTNYTTVISLQTTETAADAAAAAAAPTIEHIEPRPHSN